MTFDPNYAIDSQSAAEVASFIEAELRAAKIPYGEDPELIWRRTIHRLAPAHLGIRRVDEEIQGQRYALYRPEWYSY
ncbi:MAG: hypothetical protein ACE5OZ_11415 [Candidatus Heimdallarchaeota archaeon]